ncbi:MAG: hypothetical protein AMXMBFR61_01740 [Fimbriimonadales bacterium]
MASDPTKPWGPDNPHPLSTMKTELVWEGKYDEYGNRRPVRLPDFPLVLQKIETVDAPRDTARAEQPGLFDEEQFRKSAHRDDFRNMLIWGDNKLVCAALLKEFRGKIDLIYIDPPFDVGADFTMDVRLGENDSVQKEQSAMEAVAYRDTWGGGTDSYLHMLAERLGLMRELLHPSGALFLHVGTGVAAAVECLARSMFGDACVRNQIIVKRVTKNLQRQFASVRALPGGHDVVLWVTADPSSRWASPMVEQEPTHPRGYWKDFWSTADRPTMRYELLGVTPSTGQWKWSSDRAKRAAANYEEYLNVGARAGVDLMDWWAGRSDIEFVRLSPTGKVEHWVPPFHSKFLDTVWYDLGAYSFAHGYTTEKSEALLRRVLESFSSEGDLVADFFCGSGTTMAVAEKLGRRWIGCDLGRYAIHVSRKRLIGVQRELHAAGKPYRSFDVYNLGRYERQWWQMERLQGADEQHRATVLKFFRAAPLESPPHPLLHGTKGGAYVHVDGIDSIMTADEVRAVAEAAKAAGGKRVICLAWEFEMNLRLRIAGVEKDTGIEVSLKYIPREIMEANRDEVQFFDAAAVQAEAFVRKHPETGEPSVDVRLINFLPSLSEVPEKELEALKERAVRSPFDFIDFWAVDFEHRDGKAFEHHWQDYRTRKDRSLKTESDCYFRYTDRGSHRICVKVIDVFGVDTTTVIEVQV